MLAKCQPCFRATFAPEPPEPPEPNPEPKKLETTVPKAKIKPVTAKDKSEAAAALKEFKRLRAVKVYKQRLKDGYVKPPRVAPKSEAQLKRLGLPTQADYDKSMRGVQGRLFDINKKLVEGKLTPELWAEAFDKELYQGHLEAYVLGRKRGGDANPNMEDAGLRARQVKDGESDYLQGYTDADGNYHRGFLEDVRQGDPRYVDEEGNFIEGSLDERTSLYVGRMRGTAGEGFVEASPDMEIDWELGDAEHCSDCPEIADMSPYTEDTLWTHPGEGDCPCLGNCACELVREDGVSGFGRFDDDIEAEDLDAAA